MKSEIKRCGGDIFLEIYPENREEETELAMIFLSDEIFVQEGLPEVEAGPSEESVNRLKKLVFRLKKKESR